MALSHKQLMRFMSGASDDARHIKKEWKDAYGNSVDPQVVIDDLYDIVDDIYDVVSQHVYDQEQIKKILEKRAS